EIDGLGLAAHSYSRRGARRDDVARLQRHELADVAHDRGNRKDHGARVARLHALAVDVQPHIEVLHVADLVASHEPGTHGAEGVAALALVPGAAALRLVFPLGEVVDDAIPGDVLQGVTLLHITGRRTDHDTELDLPIGLLRSLRDHDFVIGSLQATHRLGEDYGLRGNGQIGLRSVIGVIQADGNELAGAAKGTPRRGLPGAAGSEAGSMAASRLRPAGERCCGVRSGMLPASERIRPWESRIPGCSWPAGP